MWAQVVANPFVFSRLQRPGQPVPFLFAEFQPREAVQPGAISQDTALNLIAAPAAPAPASSADVLRGIMDIVRGMLGPTVRPQGIIITS